MSKLHVDPNNFLFKHTAWMLSTFSASISTVCSILVIVFIFRSRKLSTPYHKIMLFMSCWDVASSFAIALATLPMPDDVHEIYPFAGSAFGNAATCACQGLIIVVGGMYTIWSNCTLNIYYVCAIKYGIAEETINRRILPTMLGVSTVYVCIINGIGLSFGVFNPRPYEPFCLAGPYPHNCLEEDAVECTRGDMSHSMESFFVNTIMVTGSLSLICIITSMVAVIVTVFKTELAWREYGTMEDSSSTSSRTAKFNNTRTALRQALMYITAFILTWIWLGIALIAGNKVWNNPLKLFFQPLQGFFNAAIFFMSKVSILCKSNSRLTKWEALRQTIVSPWTVPEMVVSQIGVVDDDDDDSSINSLDNWNTNIRRTGRLGSNMPPVVSVAPSNDTPSLNLSRAISSDNTMVASRKGDANTEDGNADQAPGAGAETNEEKIANAANDTEEEINTDLPSNRATDDSHPRRKYYRWPPPNPPSSSSGSINSIWNFRYRMGGGAGNCAKQSKEDENAASSASDSKSSQMSLSLSQGVSSSMGTSQGCSAIISSTRSANLSNLAESFDDDDMCSKRFESGRSSDEGVSFA